MEERDSHPFRGIAITLKDVYLSRTYYGDGSSYRGRENDLHNWIMGLTIDGPEIKIAWSHSTEKPYNQIDISCLGLAGEQHFTAAGSLIKTVDPFFIAKIRLADGLSVLSRVLRFNQHEQRSGALAAIATAQGGIFAAGYSKTRRLPDEHHYNYAFHALTDRNGLTYDSRAILPMYSTTTMKEGE